MATSYKGAGIVAALAAVWLLSSSFYTLSEGQKGLIIRLGAPIDVDADTGVWSTNGLPMLYVPRHFFINNHLAIEAALGRGWTGKIEYLYMDLGSVFGNDAPACIANVCPPVVHPTSFSAGSGVIDNILRVGANYRF